MGIGENTGENTGINTGTSRLSSPGGGGGDWQLPAGHYYEAIPFTSTPYASQQAADTFDYVMFPRPDSETNSWARHKWAHPQMDYEIPVCVRGGAFPYHMEIDTDNTDAALTGSISIGADYDSPDSYRVTIPAATIAGLNAATDYAVYIKVTDQAGKQVKVWWTFQKEAAELDHFYFVDNSGANGDGRFATPFNTITEPGWGESGNGALSAHKICVVKVGNSLTVPYDKTASWTWNASQFPCGIIGMPGEQAVIDCNNLFMLFGASGSGASDGFFWGFKAINAKTDVSDFTGGFGVFLSGNRHLVGNLELVVNAYLDRGGNNHCLFQQDNSIMRHLCLVDLDVSEMYGGDQPNGGGLTMLDGMDTGMIDNITYRNWGTLADGIHLMFAKRSITDITIRRITALDNINCSNRLIDIRSDASSLNFNNIEITRCNVYTTYDRTSVAYIRTTANDGLTARDGPFHAYFNTLRNAGSNAISFDESCALLLNVRNNAASHGYDTSADGPTDVGCATPVVTNTENVANGSFNADGTLTDAYLTGNGLTRGTRGHEVA